MAATWLVLAGCWAAQVDSSTVVQTSSAADIDLLPLSPEDLALLEALTSTPTPPVVRWPAPGPVRPIPGVRWRETVARTTADALRSLPVLGGTLRLAAPLVLRDGVLLEPLASAEPDPLGLGADPWLLTGSLRGRADPRRTGRAWHGQLDLESNATENEVMLYTRSADRSAGVGAQGGWRGEDAQVWAGALGNAGGDLRLRAASGRLELPREGKNAQLSARGAMGRFSVGADWAYLERASDLSGIQRNLELQRTLAFARATWDYLVLQTSYQAARERWTDGGEQTADLDALQLRADAQVPWDAGQVFAGVFGNQAWRRAKPLTAAELYLGSNFVANYISAQVVGRALYRRADTDATAWAADLALEGPLGALSWYLEGGRGAGAADHPLRFSIEGAWHGGGGLRWQGEAGWAALGGYHWRHQRYRLSGVEAEGAWWPTAGCTVAAILAWGVAEEDTQPLIAAPTVRGHVSVRYDFESNAWLELHGRGVSGPVPSDLRSRNFAPWLRLGMLAGVRLGAGFGLALAVENALDVSLVEPDTGLPGAGIDLSVRLGWVPNP